MESSAIPLKGPMVTVPQQLDDAYRYLNLDIY